MALLVSLAVVLAGGRSGRESLDRLLTNTTFGSWSTTTNPQGLPTQEDETFWFHEIDRVLALVPESSDACLGAALVLQQPLRGLANFPTLNPLLDGRRRTEAAAKVRARQRDLLRAAARLSPEDPDVWRVVAALALHSSDTERGTWLVDSDEILELLREGSARDPENGIYDYCLALVDWNRAAKIRWGEHGAALDVRDEVLLDAGTGHFQRGLSRRFVAAPLFPQRYVAELTRRSSLKPTGQVLTAWRDTVRTQLHETLSDLVLWRLATSKELGKRGIRGDSGAEGSALDTILKQIEAGPEHLERSTLISSTTLSTLFTTAAEQPGSGAERDAAWVSATFREDSLKRIIAAQVASSLGDPASQFREIPAALIRDSELLPWAVLGLAIFQLIVFLMAAELRRYSSRSQVSAVRPEIRLWPWVGCGLVLVITVEWLTAVCLSNSQARYLMLLVVLVLPWIVLGAVLVLVLRRVGRSIPWERSSIPPGRLLFWLIVGWTGLYLVIAFPVIASRLPGAFDATTPALWGVSAGCLAAGILASWFVFRRLWQLRESVSLTRIHWLSVSVGCAIPVALLIHDSAVRAIPRIEFWLDSYFPMTALASSVDPRGLTTTAVVKVLTLNVLLAVALAVLMSMGMKLHEIRRRRADRSLRSLVRLLLARRSTLAPAERPDRVTLDATAIRALQAGILSLMIALSGVLLYDVVMLERWYHRGLSLARNPAPLLEAQAMRETQVRANPEKMRRIRDESHDLLSAWDKG